MEDAIASIVVVVLTIVGTVYVAWRSATTHYYRQRCWDRKAQTYADIVAPLGAISFTLWEWENKFTSVVNHLPQEYAQQLEKERRDAVILIKKLASAADFLITAETGRAPREAAGTFDASFNASHPIEGIDADSKAIDKCIAIVKAEAKKDLRRLDCPLTSANPKTLG